MKSFLTGAKNMAKAGMVPDSLVGLEIGYILVWQIGGYVVEWHFKAELLTGQKIHFSAYAQGS